MTKKLNLSAQLQCRNRQAFAIVEIYKNDCFKVEIMVGVIFATPLNATFTADVVIVVVLKLRFLQLKDFGDVAFIVVVVHSKIRMNCP